MKLLVVAVVFALHSRIHTHGMMRLTTFGD
jgi:hypothetical protein